MIFKRALISVFEIIFVFLLLTSSMYYLSFNYPSSKIDVDYSLDSYLTILKENKSFRELVYIENLSSDLTQNYDPYFSEFNSYSFYIGNGSIVKKITDCDAEYLKDLSETILFTGNSTQFGFRVLTLGVCQ